MKTLTVPVDEATWQAAQEAATARHTTVDMLVTGFLHKVATQHRSGRDEELRECEELVKALASSGAVVGEKPTRERTYSDRRFHRH